MSQSMMTSAIMLPIILAMTMAVAMMAGGGVEEGDDLAWPKLTHNLLR